MVVVTWSLMISAIFVLMLNMMGQMIVVMVVVMWVARDWIVVWFEKHDHFTRPTT
jgi:hypothetical protein